MFLNRMKGAPYGGRQRINLKNFQEMNSPKRAVVVCWKAGLAFRTSKGMEKASPKCRRMVLISKWAEHKDFLVAECLDRRLIGHQTWAPPPINSTRRRH